MRDMLSDKGLLADLSEYISEDQLLHCVETAYTTSDGIVALPFFMRLSTLVTTQFTLSSRTKLTREVLYEMAANLKPGEALFAEDVYTNLKTIGQYDFLDLESETCSFDSAEYTEYLEFLLQLKDGAYTDEDLQVLYYETYGSDYCQEYCLLSMDATDIINQNRLKFVSMDLYTVNSISAMLLCFSGQNINYCGYPSDEGTAVLLSSDAMFSMSAQAVNVEGAAAFMQYLLSDEIQTCSRVKTFGLPVSRSAMEEVFPVGYIYYCVGTPSRIITEDRWIAYHPEAVVLKYKYTSESWSVEEKESNNVFASVRVTEDDRDLFIRFLDRAVVKTSSDTTLREILDEEVSYVEAGIRSAAEGGRILQDRVKIYLSE